MRVQDDVIRERILAPSRRATGSGERTVLRWLYQRLQRTDHDVLHRRRCAGALRVPRALRHRAIRRGDPDITARGRRGIGRRGGDRTTAR